MPLKAEYWNKQFTEAVKLVGCLESCALLTPWVWVSVDNTFPVSTNEAKELSKYVYALRIGATFETAT